MTHHQHLLKLWLTNTAIYTMAKCKRDQTILSCKEDIQPNSETFLDLETALAIMTVSLSNPFSIKICPFVD